MSIDIKRLATIFMAKLESLLSYSNMQNHPLPLVVPPSFLNEIKLVRTKSQFHLFLEVNARRNGLCIFICKWFRNLERQLLIFCGKPNLNYFHTACGYIAITCKNKVLLCWEMCHFINITQYNFLSYIHMIHWIFGSLLHGF